MPCGSKKRGRKKGGKRRGRKKYNIWTPEQENFAEALRKETHDMLKKIALENNCDVEELKCTFDSEGVVNVQRMTLEEMEQAEDERQRAKYLKELRKMKGLD